MKFLVFITTWECLKNPKTTTTFRKLWSNNKDFKDIKIGLGSTSQVKKDAIQQVFQNSIVETVYVQSIVREQPVGYDEIIQGARHRALQAKQQCPNLSFWVGIENGLVEHKPEGDFFYKKEEGTFEYKRFQEKEEEEEGSSKYKRFQEEEEEEGTSNEDTWFDIACIVIIFPNDEEHVMWSDVLYVPDYMINMALDPLTKQPIRLWSISKDPHQQLSNRSRAKYISDGITSYFDRFIDKSINKNDL